MKERMLLDGGREDEASDLLHTTHNFLGESLPELDESEKRWEEKRVR